MLPKFRKNSILLCSTTAMAAVLFAAPARADALSDMERQIHAMQAQLAKMKKEHDVEMKRIHTQLAEQRESEERNPYAARNNARNHSYTMPPPLATASSYGNSTLDMPSAPVRLPAITANTPYAQLTGTPTGKVLDLYGPLHRGQIQIGGVRITLGGYLESAGIFRSRNNVSDISSNFGTIPFANSPNYHMNEYHQTERQSRLSALVEGDITKTLRAQGYIETDFQGAGASSNSRQSNSYVLRSRVFYGQLIDDANDWTVLGGQNWSLVTLYNHGLAARDEQVPLVIEAQYVPGFNWTRNTQVRVVKGFDHGHYHIAASIENPQQVIAAGSGGVYLPPGAKTSTYQNAGVNVNNPSTNYSTDVAPDVIAKFAADPGWGHYEVYGLLRFPHSRVSYVGYGRSHTTVAGGVGGGMVLPLIDKKLYFQASGLVGTGVGRYGSANIPDVTMGPNGQIRPVNNANALAGIYGNPSKSWQLYAYGGMEMVRNRSSFDVNGKAYGYGNPLYEVGGCAVEESPLACQASVNKVVQGTTGFWWTAEHGDYGTIKVGAQYSYTYLTSFSGVGGHPHTDDNMVFFSLRYMPFQ